MAYEIYISSKINNDLKDVIHIANRHSLNIELKCFSRKKDFNDFDSKLADLKNTLKDFQGKLSLHAPYDAVVYISNNQTKREEKIELFDKTLQVAKALNIKLVNFHAGFSPSKEHVSNYTSKFIHNQVAFWKCYIKNLEEIGIVGVLENTHEPNPEILIDIVDKVDSNNLKLCIDTGHITHNTAIDVTEWIKQEDKRLYHMHLHNNNGNNDEHNSLLKGIIDFKRVFQSLRENDLFPSLLLEIYDYNTVMESINFMQKYIKV